MKMNSYPLCDFNRDGYCDRAGLAIFQQNMMGNCQDNLDYHPVADISQDGIPDSGDRCPSPDKNPIVVVDNCNTNVQNKLLRNGCTIAQDIKRQCIASATNQRVFTSCFSHITNDWVKQRIITGADKGAIESCAAQASIP